MGRDFEPDLGKLAVRDYRGASGNVAMVEMGTRLAIERAMTVTLHLQLAHRSSIPTSKRRHTLQKGTASGKEKVFRAFSTGGGGANERLREHRSLNQRVGGITTAAV